MTTKSIGIRDFETGYSDLALPFLNLVISVLILVAQTSVCATCY